MIFPYKNKITIDYAMRYPILALISIGNQPNNLELLNLRSTLTNRLKKKILMLTISFQVMKTLKN